VWVARWRRRTGDVAGPESARDRASKGPGKALCALLCWTMAAYIVYREHILPWLWDTHFLDAILNPVAASRGLDRWLIPVSILGRYTSLLIFPWRLSMDYSASVFTSTFQPGDIYFYVGIGALIAYAIACGAALRRRSAATLFCLACMGLTYFLISNIMLIGTVMGERLIYLPSVFFVILMASAIARGMQSRVHRRWLSALVVLLIALGSLRTVTYAARWNDPMTLSEAAWHEQPLSSQVALLYARELWHQNSLDRAAAVLAEARQRTPGSAQLWAFSAQIAMDANDLDAAERFMDQASVLAPEWAYHSALWRELSEKRLAASTRPVVQK